MKTLVDYPVTFPYGATSPPYSSAHPHRGNDRKCPTGTPIRIGETIIGLTGNTGLSSGPHCHTQAWTGTTSNTKNPSAYEFKGGTVINTGTGEQWGKFVTMKVGGVNLTYCHLSEIKAKIGDKVSDMYKGHDAKHWYDLAQERKKMILDARKALR